MTGEELARFRALSASDASLPERVIEGVYRALARPGDVMIDGGANRGFHTVRMRDACPDGRVIAYEALPTMAAALGKRFAGKSEVTVRHCALQDDPALAAVQFQRVPERLSRSAIRSTTLADGHGSTYRTEAIEVPATTLDSDLAALGIALDAVRFIKLDLEGGEYHALLGAKALLELGGAIIAMENGKDAPAILGYDIADVDTLMAGVGYAWLRFDGEGIERLDHSFWYAFACPAALAAEVAPAIRSAFLAVLVAEEDRSLRGRASRSLRAVKPRIIGAVSKRLPVGVKQMLRRWFPRV